MTEPSSQPEKPKAQPRFSQEQYEMLKRCSDKKDMTEWNEWREQNPNEPILLDGRSFHGCYLSGAFLNTGAVVINPGSNLHKQWVFRGEVYLRDALFLQAKLRGTDFRGAHLKAAMFNFAELERGCLELADLRGASLLGTNLQGTNFSGAKLQGADFSHAIVDGGTLIWQCEVGRKTKFEGVGLDAARMYPELKQLLEYNIRRKNWEEWYKQHKILKWPVWWFWLLSDYGLRTWWIIAWFFGLAFAFALLYWLLPNTVMVKETGGDIRGLWHAIYFSVVTMTTLDFGDIAANPDSWLGQALLMIQVILGYVLLGALVTRFAVLFTAGGPAGKFADEKTIRERLKELWSKHKKKR